MNENEILGIAANATSEDIRAAYLSKVKEFPPDRSPVEFERIRDAYEKLQDPRSRAKTMLFTSDGTAPLVSLIDGLKPERIFVGPQFWKEVLKSK